MMQAIMVKLKKNKPKLLLLKLGKKDLSSRSGNPTPKPRITTIAHNVN